MQLFSGKMEGEARGAVNTFSPLTNQPIAEVEMAKPSLPNQPKRVYRHLGCRVPYCPRRHKARGYCNKHYQRVKSHNDPYVLGRRWNGSPEDRFWDRVDKTPGYGPNGDCWLWTGSCVESGHGRVKREGKLILTHRYSYKITHGLYPEPCGLHTCDVPSCVNPSHIYAGTKQDNARDKMVRGRCNSPKGSQVRVSKLKEMDIPVVRTLLSQGHSYRAVAQRFGVSSTSIRWIATGRTWKEVM